MDHIGEQSLLKRRPRGSVRPLLIEAAARVFSERGYSGATTREIAEVAGTSEALIFRYFGSKANLFEVAVIEPFTEFIAAFSDEWTARDRVETFKDPSDEFVGWLYRSLRDRRQMVLAMITAQEGDLDVGHSMARDALDRLTGYVVHAARESGWAGVDFAIATRLVVGMVISAALFDDWLFGGWTPGRDLDAVLVEEMSGIVLGGVTRTPFPGAGAKIVPEPDLSRIVVTGPSSAVVMAAATAWISAQGPQVEIADLSWQAGSDGNRLHVYFRAR